MWQTVVTDGLKGEVLQEYHRYSAFATIELVWRLSNAALGAAEAQPLSRVRGTTEHRNVQAAYQACCTIGFESSIRYGVKTLVPLADGKWVVIKKVEV